jgi:hypothetical protein
MMQSALGRNQHSLNFIRNYFPFSSSSLARSFLQGSLSGGGNFSSKLRTNLGQKTVKVKGGRYEGNIKDGNTILMDP